MVRATGRRLRMPGRTPDERPAYIGGLTRFLGLANNRHGALRAGNVRKQTTATGPGWR